jgi:hypothetical protein
MYFFRDCGCGLEAPTLGNSVIVCAFILPENKNPVRAKVSYIMRRIKITDFTMSNFLRVTIVDNNHEAALVQKHSRKACSIYCDILTEVDVISLVVPSNGY